MPSKLLKAAATRNVLKRDPMLTGQELADAVADEIEDVQFGIENGIHTRAEYVAEAFA